MIINMVPWGLILICPKLEDLGMNKYYVSIIKEENYVVEIEAESKDEAKMIVEKGQYVLDTEVHIATFKSRVEFCF